MGATQALKYPDQAVCTEFSDVLIASARERGIYVREVQGFAFANERELRPVQENSDILHSWVEYYDQSKNIWVPIDPTWQSTSGIDYFNSFDFNHIVFALHGKKADYPFPAGSYKSAPGGKDIFIEPTTDILVENKKIAGSLAQIPLPDTGDLFTADLAIKNTGNVNLWSIPIHISADNATIATPSIIISHLLPGEIKKIPVSFVPKSSLLYQNVTFTVFSNSIEILKQKIQVPLFLTSFKPYLIPGGIIILGVFILLALLIKTIKK